jgi:uncharacterized protein YprB with RNaseH-like and TPR domain
MKAPVRRLTKDKIIWLAEHHCKHGITYLEHYNCFLRESPPDSPFSEKIGFFDIETTNFNADYAFLLSYAILDMDSDELIVNVIKPDEIHSQIFDKRLIQDLVKDLRKFSRIVVYHGTDYHFDIPFCRTRALRWGIEFPAYRELYVNDLYMAVKSKLKIARKQLKTVCDLFGIPAKEHPGKPDIWIRASVGDPEALEYVKVHNIEDVISLKQLWIKLKDMILIGRRSI